MISHNAKNKGCDLSDLSVEAGKPFQSEIKPKKQQKGVHQQEQETSQITAVSTEGFPRFKCCKSGDEPVSRWCTGDRKQQKSSQEKPWVGAADGLPWAQSSSEGKTSGTSDEEALKTPAVICFTLVRETEFGLIILNRN